MAELNNEIELLCHKVLEVLNNNDWPTEEGHDYEERPNYIRMLCDSILGKLKNGKT